MLPVVTKQLTFRPPLRESGTNILLSINDLTPQFPGETMNMMSAVLGCVSVRVKLISLKTTIYIHVDKVMFFHCFIKIKHCKCDFVHVGKMFNAP